MLFEEDFKGIISIDIGEQHFCVGYWQNNVVEIVRDEFGNHAIPAFVSILEDEIFVGEEARRLSLKNPENTFFGIRRFVGRSFEDEVVQKELKNVPYKVVEHKGEPVVEVVLKNEKKKFRFGELMIILIKNVKTLTEKHLQKNVKQCLLTVPPSFNDIQRQMLKDCGILTKFDSVVRVVNEPTACCLAYGLDRKTDIIERYVVVFNLGRKLDVSVILLEDGLCDLLSHVEDFEVGGDSINDSFCGFLCEKIQEKHNMNVRNNPKSMALLRDACEKAKRRVSSDLRTTIEIKNLFEDVDFVIQVSRSKFETFLPIRKCIHTIRKALEDANIGKGKIHNVVFSGGSMNIPRIQNVVSEYFEEEEVVLKELDFQQVVARGGALQASTLCGPGYLGLDFLQDVISLSLGFGNVENEMVVFMTRYTCIPVSRVRVFSLSDFPDVELTKENKMNLTICIYEGERKDVSDNHLLGKLTLMGIPRNEQELIQIRVTFNIDSKSVTRVTAEELQSGCKNECVISNVDGRLTREEIEAHVNQAREFQRVEEIVEQEGRICERSRLESFCYTVKNLLLGEVISGGVEEVKKMSSSVDECIRWIDLNPDEKKEVYVMKKNEIESVLPIQIIRQIIAQERESILDVD